MTHPRQIRLAVIPGDGIGPEVVAAAVPVLGAAVAADGDRLDVVELDWGGERYLREGAAMPPDAAEVVRGTDAVLFGAVGRPDVPDHELVWGLIIGLRQQLDLAVNIRPVRAFPGVPGPSRGAETTDLVIVRENTEGEYVGAGGLAHAGTGRRRPRDRGALAPGHRARRPPRLRPRDAALTTACALVTKSNAMRHGYPLWDRVVREVAEQYAEVDLEIVLVDAMAARMIQVPRRSTSCSPAISSGTSSPTSRRCSRRHGDGAEREHPAGWRRPGRLRAGPRVARPTSPARASRTRSRACSPAPCFSRTLGHDEAARRVRTAIAAALTDPDHHTPDLGGTATTDEMASAVMLRMETAR